MYIISITLTFHERKIIFAINCIINKKLSYLLRIFREMGALAKVCSSGPYYCFAL